MLMNPLKTFDDYQNEVRNEYEIKKNELYSGQLLHPKPSRIRTLLSACYDDADNVDKERFRLFFESDPNKDLKKQIEKFDLDRLKPIIMFLKRQTASTSDNIIEIIAILIDFKPRPYNKYREGGTIKSPEPEKESVITPEFPHVVISHDNIEDKPYHKSLNNHIIKWQPIMFIGILLTSIILFYNTFLTDCNLMIWKKDHYEKVDCEIVNDDSIGKAYISLDETLLENMRKVKVDSMTTFFHKDGTPRIWYYKVSDNELEYFTSPGLHPENKKTLKPITERMINKYVLKKDIHD